MLEFVVLLFLCRWIGKEARARGRAAFPYQLTTAIVCLVSEAVGIVLAAVAFGRPNDYYVPYLIGAVVGLAGGAACAFLIVKNLANTVQVERDAQPKQEAAYERLHETGRSLSTEPRRKDREEAPSAMQEDEPQIARLIGMVGFLVALLGGLLLIAYASRGTILFGNPMFGLGPSIFYTVLGLCLMLF